MAKLLKKLTISGLDTKREYIIHRKGLKEMQNRKRDYTKRDYRSSKEG
jgi:hypothetical protein